MRIQVTAKKLIQRVYEQAAILSTHTNKRLFIFDKRAQREFLIDCGADHSVLTPTQFMRDLYKRKRDDRDEVCARYYAANGTPIQTYGTQLLEVTLGFRRIFAWRFTVADVTTSIIGADFLFEFGLMIDIRGKQLIDRTTKLTTTGEIRIHSVQKVSLFNVTDKFAFLFQEFKELLDDKPSYKVKEKANVTHCIETVGPPVSSKVRRLSPEKLAAAKKEFNELIRLGICRPSKSNYASSLHMVPKANTEWRPCGDYRRLNASTIPDRYPIPLLRDFQCILHGKKYFARIDLRKAYHQVPVEPSDIPKTAIITPFGLFEYLFMSFGLRNASQTFQRLIDEVLRGLDFCFAFIDDICIASDTYDQHIEHIRIVFKRLCEFGLRINPDKCIFARPEINFLGHLITSDGIKPLPEKIEAVKQFPKPTMAFELKKFIQMIGFYRRFIPNAASMQNRLQILIHGNKKKDRTKLVWTTDSENAFEEYKQALIDASLLVHPLHNAKIVVVTDASATAIGGVIHQVENDVVKPYGFFSKKLSAREVKYPTYDRELLAIYRTIKHFEYFLEGRQFDIYCDHQPLTHAFTKKANNENARRIEQLSYISEFTTNIIHIPGKENLVADMLSRIDQIDSHHIDYERIAAAQEKDDELNELMKSNTTSLQLKSVAMPDSNVNIICDVSGTNVRPFIPKQFRSIVLEQIHGLSHPGVRATTQLVKQRFVWPGIHQTCKHFVEHCIACQKSKVSRHSKAPLTQYDTTSNRFEHINVDLVGPLPESHGYTYLMTMIDRTSRWPEAVPTTNIMAETIAKALIAGWISRFGVPHRITTDRGRQFESQLFNQLNTMLGTKHLRTTSFHPQANGMIERWHRSLKTSLKAKLTNSANWIDEIPLVLLGLRTAVKIDIGASPAELTLGKTLCLPGQWFGETQGRPIDIDFVDKFRKMMNDVRPREPNYHDKPKIFVHPKLSEAKFVFIRDDAHRSPFQTPYKGPFEVVKRGDKIFKVNINGKTDTVSIDRLKPAFILVDDDDLNNNNKSKTPTNSNEEHNQLQVQRTNEPHTTTRSGRKVHFPDRFHH